MMAAVIGERLRTVNVRPITSSSPPTIKNHWALVIDTFQIHGSQSFQGFGKLSKKWRAPIAWWLPPVIGIYLAASFCSVLRSPLSAHCRGQSVKVKAQQAPCFESIRKHGISAKLSIKSAVSPHGICADSS